MRKKIYTLTALFFIVVSANAQEDSISLKDLETPNSPGFLLLDKTPTSIETPSSTKAFILSAVNSFDENNGLPKNYAAEFVPFWFVKHPKMTAFKYMGYNSTKNKQKIFSKFFRGSFSFAFINEEDSSLEVQKSNIALGFRTNIISVRSKKDIEDLKAANDTIVNRLRNQVDRMAAEIPLALSIDDPVLYSIKVAEFFEKEKLRKEEDKIDIQEILKRRPVFSLDGAVAYTKFFLNDDYSESHFGRFGAWATINFSKVLNKKAADKNYLNLYAVGRYISDGTTMISAGEYETNDFVDVGGKLELELKKLSLAYEYLYRSNDDFNTFRSNGSIKYKISDQLYLTGAFGKNFGDSNNLISLLGINWGLSSGNEKASIKKE